jgi:hypothetical protein
MNKIEIFELYNFCNNVISNPSKKHLRKFWDKELSEDYNYLLKHVFHKTKEHYTQEQLLELHLRYPFLEIDKLGLIDP